MLLRFLIQSLSVGLASAVSITVSSKGGNKTSGVQYGLMFEDINHSGEGGIYPELIRNRAFQNIKDFPPTLEGYSAFGGANLSVLALDNPLSTALTHSLRVKPGSSNSTQSGASNSTQSWPSNSTQIGFSNDGFWGIDVRVQDYAGSFYIKGEYKGVIQASLRNNKTGQVFGRTDIKVTSISNSWQQVEFKLRPTVKAPDVGNSFFLTFEKALAKQGYLDFNLISLFPPTYKNRPNGLRVDIMEALAKLNPKIFRFPGGNGLEGGAVGTQFKWNETIGPLKDRPGRPTAWGYPETSGLGLIEYMHWCDDLGMKPLLGVWDGHYLNGVSLGKEELQPYIEDALNEIEFLTGDVRTKYGALRASLGYPKPWKLEYVEVGNEDDLSDGLPTYQSYRWRMFADAIEKKYPHITVLASVPESKISLTGKEGGDYHLYSTPDGLVQSFGTFDHYQHPTIVGEVAAVFENNPNGVPWGAGIDFRTYPFWIGTVGEAVFLIGGERNADRVIGSAYAPMITNLNGSQWEPDLLAISANPDETTVSTSYHLLQLFGNNAVTKVLPTSSNSTWGPLYYTAGIDEDENIYIWKGAVYNSTSDVPVSIKFDGVKDVSKARLTVLTADDPYSHNQMYVPKEVVKTDVKTLKAGKDGKFDFSLPNLSIAVLTVDKQGHH